MLGRSTKFKAWKSGKASILSFNAWMRGKVHISLLMLLRNARFKA